MKILITTDWYKSAVNGVVTSVKNLEKGLIAQGHEVRILTLSENLSSYTEGNVIYIGSIKAEKIYPNARIKVPVRSRAVAYILRDIIEWKPDIIHSQCEFSTFSIARRVSALTGAPIVHTYHTIYEDYTHYFLPSVKLGRNAVRLFTRYIARHTSAMIAPTAKVKNILLGYGCYTDIDVVPTGLDLDRIISKATHGGLAAMKERLGIPTENKVVAYVGRLAEEKNLDEIIEYFGKIKPDKTTLLIVGDGPYRRNIEDKIRDCGIEDITVMTGMVSPDSIKDYYALADVFTSASQSETQGLTYIEAMANGLPLLCRADDCLEDVLLDGITGFSYVSFEEYAQRLNTLLTSDNSLMGENAAGLVRERFSLDSFAKGAERVYVDVLMREYENKVV